MAINKPLLWAALGVALGAEVAQAQGKPLSAIDWLSDTVVRPPKAPVLQEAPIKPIGEPDRITTSAISDRNLDAVGLLPARMTGFDRGLWAKSSSQTLIQMFAADSVEGLPALRDLVLTLMLAELDPPWDTDGSGKFLLARVDKLLQMGALEAASSLLAKAGPPTPDLFRRTFDVALLLGTENEACAVQRASPRIAPTFPARVFCLARGGDWTAAALTFNTAQALGQLSDEEEALLDRFLDTESFEDADPLPPPERLTPLVLRLYEAIGEPVYSTGLPVAFAHGEMTPTNGWKARLEAGERLARIGAISPALMFDLYLERKPAASGGVWGRVRAVQAFDAALQAGDRAQVGKELARVWQAMSDVELEVPFAEAFGGRLSDMELSPEASALAFRINLLGPNYEEAAIARKPADEVEAFLIALARGLVDVTPPPQGLARAIAPVFPAKGAGPELSAPSLKLLEEGRMGEAALLAVQKVTAGTVGDLRSVTEGLALLRKLRLETAARKAALQLMLLERRG